MKTRCTPQQNRAMTLVEAVVVIVVIAFISLMLLPALMPRHHHYPFSCANNLKQIGLAAKIWAGDNNDKYPMQVSVSNGGTMELTETPEAWRTYQVMSNELSTPKTLLCPYDEPHSEAVSFNWNSSWDIPRTNVSYFIGVDAVDTNPAAMLAGDDRFILNKTPVKPGLLKVTANDSLDWDSAHHYATVSDGLIPKKLFSSGYLLFCDGSVQPIDNKTLKGYLGGTGFVTNRFFVP